MSNEFRDYSSDDITVQYSVKRCIHAAECVRRLPQVFDTNKRPWIQPANASADDIADMIPNCPSGALRYQRKDGGSVEAVPQHNTLRLAENGPLYLRGSLEIQDSSGNVLSTDTRVALCRCGASSNKPYCDNSHKDIGFTAAPVTSVNATFPESAAQPAGQVVVTPAQNGPLLLQGNVELLDAKGGVVFQGDKAALCRCGGSQNKPFCDGTHNTIGFLAD
ncbi:MAG: CDGSH iron-sulfur domain-containing protein [bacterium]|nr:CDGSH iron-sulfur domain-containing protein [bacterium]